MGYKAPVLFTIPVFHAIHDPADSQSYNWGMRVLALSGAVTYNRIYLPVDGRISKAYVRWIATTATGTAEDVSLYIRLNDTTDYLVATVSAASDTKQFTNTSLNIPIVAGDYITMKTVTPAWVTNPQGVTQWGLLLIETA